LRLDSQELLCGRQGNEGAGEYAVVTLVQLVRRDVEGIAMFVGSGSEGIEVPELCDESPLVARDDGATSDERVSEIGGQLDVRRAQPQVRSKLTEPCPVGPCPEGATLGHGSTTGQHDDCPPSTIPDVRRLMTPDVLLRLSLQMTACESVGAVIVDEVAGADHP
jgi:hypothetical protein